MVLKPSELTPMTALELGAIVHAVGETVALPRGEPVVGGSLAPFFLVVFIHAIIIVLGSQRPSMSAVSRRPRATEHCEGSTGADEA